MHRDHRFGTPSCEPFEQNRRAGVAYRSARGEHAGERLRIAEAEVNTLSGERVHAVGGIPDERHPVGDGRRQPQRLEGKGRRPRNHPHRAKRVHARLGDARGERFG